MAPTVDGLVTGMALLEPGVRGRGDARAAPVGKVQRDERLMVVVVDVGEVAQLGGGQFVLSGQEAHLARSGTQPGEAVGGASVLWTCRISTIDPSRSATSPVVTTGRRRRPGRGQAGIQPRGDLRATGGPAATEWAGSVARVMP
jgi:hypothetical protein